MATATFPRTTHSIAVGYVCWLLGFLGMHRFYFGKPITGTIWFFTGGLLLIGCSDAPRAPDARAASLLPGDPVLEVNDHWVSGAGKSPRRMTLTYPTLNAARLIVFVVSGRKKAEALRGVLNDDRTMPAARLEAPNVRFFVDAEAASRL